MASSQQKRDWNSLYREYQESGLSLQEYAQKVGITYSWLMKKFRSMEKAGFLSKEGPAAKETETEFIPVTVKEVSGEAEKYHQAETRITIGKAVMDVPLKTEEAALIRILKAVSEVC